VPGPGAVALVTALFAAACNPTSPAPQRPPRIVFQETARDFGHAKQGTTVTQVYTFRNAGGLDLAIDNTRPSCQCTAVITSPRVVPPGGEGTIQATLDTSDDFGPTTRTITVYSNDPAQPVTTLTLSGHVDAEVAADPPQLYVGHVSRGQAAPNEVRLLGAVATGADAPIETSGNVLTASVHDATSGTGERLHVTIKSSAPLGRFAEKVSVRTGSRRRPVLAISVTGIVDAEAPAATPVAEHRQ